MWDLVFALKLALLALLIGLTISDIKEKRINIVPIIMVAFVALLADFMGLSIGLLDGMLGCIVGVILLIASKLTKESIGLGDGALFTAAGLILGFWQNVILLWLASLLCGMYGLALMFFKNKRKNYEIPFMPFVTGVYSLFMACNIWEKLV